MPKVTHLLLATVEDAFDRASWSGIPYSLRVALEKQVERLTVFRPSRPARQPLDVLKRLRYGADRYPLWMTPATLRKNARELQRAIAQSQPDAVLSISSQCIARLTDPGVPVFMFSDAPWLAWQQAYEGTIGKPMRRMQFATEEASAAARIDGLCFGSDWAVEEADRLYGAADTRRSHAFVTPLGANWTPSQSASKVLAAASARRSDSLQLLFVGKDWERKGGPLAVDVARLLHDKGVQVKLHIVGCTPQLPPDTAAYTQVHGLVRQSDDPDSPLAKLFRESHFLLVPTTAECFGIIFAEAQAFAMPPISRAVHALPTLIQDGKNGILLPEKADAAEYAERILALLHAPQRYMEMCCNARAHYEQRLNWDACARGILDAMEATG